MQTIQIKEQTHEDLDKNLKDAIDRISKFVKEQKQLGPEARKILEENLWDMV